MPELKPCRLCGSADIKMYRGIRPKCQKCGCSQEFVPGSESVASWNNGPAESEAKSSRKVTKQPGGDQDAAKTEIPA